ncbi:diacylglycerol kinase [Candidatus Desantisbacteria bacterium]|nr:diacylglycerol kinase [Candidatus Desantisbacteria bacterium]
MQFFHGIIDSFNYAIAGVIHGLKTQRNMQIHVIAAVVVLIASLFLNLSRLELVALFFAISLVLISEMFNTAVETIVDLITDSHHPLAGTAKDIGAGAVLIATINALAVGYLILYQRFNMSNGFLPAAPPTIHITFVSLALVVIMVIAIKAVYGWYSFLRGGMPSGHTAVASSIWVSTTFISQDISVSLLVFIITVLIANSRIRAKIHTPVEVLVGAFIGSGMTLIIFLMCR